MKVHLYLLGGNEKIRFARAFTSVCRDEFPNFDAAVDHMRPRTFSRPWENDPLVLDYPFPDGPDGDPGIPTLRCATALDPDACLAPLPAERERWPSPERLGRDWFLLVRREVEEDEAALRARGIVTPSARFRLAMRECNELTADAVRSVAPFLAGEPVPLRIPSGPAPGLGSGRVVVGSARVPGGPERGGSARSCPDGGSDRGSDFCPDCGPDPGSDRGSDRASGTRRR